MEGPETAWRVLQSGLHAIQSMSVSAMAKPESNEKALLIANRLCEEEKKSALRRKIAKILLSAPGTFAKLNAVKGKAMLSNNLYILFHFFANSFF